MKLRRSQVDKNISKIIDKAVEKAETDEDINKVKQIVENSKGTISNKIIDTANNNTSNKKKISEVIVDIIQNNPEKAVEIIENNSDTKTVVETIKNKIENDEAVTSSDFDNVFDTNVSPN